MTTITAEVVADSISPAGVMLTTLKLRYPRALTHEQLLTHRVFSRNASSSRAKPNYKWIKEIEEDCAYPTFWGKNKAGMSAGGEIEDVEWARDVWFGESRHAIEASQLLTDTLGLHKQHSNRLLLPFQHIDVLVTSTEWNNFFDLRMYHDAQPDIQALANAMYDAMEKSEPKGLKPGEYHLPFITDKDRELVRGEEFEDQSLIAMSIARCARVSYSNHDGTELSIEKDLKLYNKLKESEHLSPFEHVATPMIEAYSSSIDGLEDGATHIDTCHMNNIWSGNFRGWIQYRAKSEWF